MKLSVISEESDENLVSAFNTSQAAYSTRPLVKISEIGLNFKLDLLQKIKALVDPALTKYTKYFVIQVANGYLPVNRMQDDAPMLNKTIAGFIKHARKGDWKKSKNIYDFPNWRILSDDVIELEAINADFAEKGEDTKVIFSQERPGDDGASTAYWLRKLLTVKGAYKYGRGTQWCTASDPAQFENPTDNPADYYLKNGELYIVEMKKEDSRKPIIQMYFPNRVNGGGHHDDVGGTIEFKGVQNREVARFGPNLGGFIRDALRSQAVSEMSESSVAILQKKVRIAKPIYVPKEPSLDGDEGPLFVGFTGTRELMSEVAACGGEATENFNQNIQVLIVSEKLNIAIEAILQGILQEDGGELIRTSWHTQDGPAESNFNFKWPSNKVASAAKYNIPLFSVERLHAVLEDADETENFYNQINQPDDVGAYDGTMYLGPIYRRWAEVNKKSKTPPVLPQ